MMVIITEMFIMVSGHGLRHVFFFFYFKRVPDASALLLLLIVWIVERFLDELCYYAGRYGEPLP